MWSANTCLPRGFLREEFTALQAIQVHMCRKLSQYPLFVVLGLEKPSDFPVADNMEALAADI